MNLIAKTIAGAVLLIAGAVTVAGCCAGKGAEDTTASGYCKANKADDACSNCCRMKGAKTAQTTSGSCQCFK
jgi:hypothetical protein